MRVDQPLLRGSAQTLPERGDETAQPLVIVVDDDTSVREALSELILSVGFQPASFGSTRELLDADMLDRPGCLILDVRMPGASGLDLQHHLAQTGNPKPVIFLTGHGDIPMTVQAMKAGAIDFLTKPVRDQTFIDAVTKAIAADAERRALAASARKSAEAYATLTARERQVLRAVVSGALNKQIAFDLEISEVTVKLHRSSMMRKMGAISLTHLFRAWQSLPAKIREELPART